MMTSLMNSVPSDRAGVASAVNGAVRETGFAFGIALLGTIMNQRYRDVLTGDQEISALRQSTDANVSGLVNAVSENINRAGHAIDGMRDQLPGAMYDLLLRTTSVAFVDGMQRGFTISAIATVGSAVVAWALIRNDRPEEAPEHMNELREDTHEEPDKELLNANVAAQPR